MLIDKETLKQALELTFKPKYMHPRRTAFIAALTPIFGAVWGADAIGRWLDDRLFPDYEDAEIGQPIFIMASPRSGTTLLHRLMSLDEQFTSYALWQTILPTLTAYKVMDGVRKVDDLTGNVLDKVQDAAARYLFRGWEGIHKTRFDEAEEDEAIFCLQMSTPSIWLAWPFVNELYRVAYVDRLPMRDKLADFFRGTVKRHMYDANKNGENKTLLAKNVLLAGRLGIVTDACPDARFVNIVRHPYRTVGSLMSFFTTPWRYHSPDIAMDGPEARAFAELAMDYALTVHRFMLELPPERGITIMYSDLIEDPEREIFKIYERFGLEASDKFRASLHEAVTSHKHYASGHEYSLEEYGLSEDLVYERLREIFDAYDLERHPTPGKIS